jgi:hypothetical protein
MSAELDPTTTAYRHFAQEARVACVEPSSVALLFAVATGERAAASRPRVSVQTGGGV